MRDAAIFQRRQHTTLTQQIVDHIRRRIVTGDLWFDTALPPIHKLASLYGVSRSTAQAAVQALAALGLVNIRRGVGVFVARPRSHAAVLDQAWRHATPNELALMRAALDECLPAEAARAVRNRPTPLLPPTVRDLRFLAMERSSHRLEVPADAFVRTDISFHQAIAAAVRGGELTAHLYRQILVRLGPAMLAAAGRQATDHSLDAAHGQLADAVTEGRVGTATHLARSIARRELASLEAALG